MSDNFEVVLPREYYRRAQLQKEYEIMKEALQKIAWHHNVYELRAIAHEALEKLK